MSEQHVLHQKINLPYRYTAGEVYTTFLDALSERRLIGSRCTRCGSLAVPARPFCPVCSQRMNDVEEVPAIGRLESWTEVTREEATVVYGAIRVGDSSAIMLHLVDHGAEALEVNMEVVPRWADDGRADITAIEAWVPAPR